MGGREEVPKWPTQRRYGNVEHAPTATVTTWCADQDANGGYGSRQWMNAPDLWKLVEAEFGTDQPPAAQPGVAWRCLAVPRGTVRPR